MNFESFLKKINEQDLLVAYFSHDGCNVCKVLRPQVEEMVAAMDGVEFLYVNTQENPQVAGQMIVFAVPTIIIFKNGQEARRYSRNLSLPELQEFLERTLTL